MALLKALTWQGITFGGADADGYLDATGLLGLGHAPRRTTMTERANGGAVAGRSVSLAREISANVKLDCYAQAELLSAVVASMHERPDPSDELPLTMAGFALWPDHEVRCYVRPEPVELDLDEDATEHGQIQVRLLWLAADPTIYSDALTFDTTRPTAASHAFTATNHGTKATDAGRAWTLAITASGTVVYPWIQFGEGPRVVFQVTMSAGQTLNVDTNRRVYIGSNVVSGRARTPGEEGANWPVLEPGDNDVTLGATSGSFGVVWKHRSTW